MTRKIALIAAAALVVIVGVWYAALWSPTTKHLHQAQAALSTAQSHAAALDSQLAVLNAEQRRLDGERPAISALLQELPRDVAVASFIDQLSGLAARAGITLTNVSETLSAGTSGAASGSTGSASAAATPKGVDVLSLSFTVSGSYNQILQFVGGVQRLPRLVEVSTLSISGGGAGPSGSASTASSSTAAAPTGLSVQMTASAYFDPAPLPAKLLREVG